MKDTMKNITFTFALSMAILFIDACYFGLISFGYYALQQFRLKMFDLNYWDYSTAGIWHMLNYFNIAYVFALVVILTFSFSFYAAQAMIKKVTTTRSNLPH
jgi:hypothetical protein